MQASLPLAHLVLATLLCSVQHHHSQKDTKCQDHQSNIKTRKFIFTDKRKMFSLRLPVFQGHWDAFFNANANNEL